ncbi:D-2-hydroxyacid dehydrogenase [Roseibacillus persicicus]|uniref:3-phosphoglycerate dehydrogenase n=1 Tax=Roseibacillus persicicus TaxID=454148 RepID=A0A918TTW9_9BACT|nr:D-2-hydroxyacid dehydrogenase [Roseibacillus persicicus]GHC61764.1 3-phosphoglycerate dehydrogenase [Roseibacillus persicicus]
MKANLRQLAIFSLAFAGPLSLSIADPAQPATDQALAEELGSLRNAQVAIEQTSPKKELTYFAGSLSEEEKEVLAKVAPNLRIVSGLGKEEALARAEEAHGVDARFANPEFLTKATNLRWVQVQSAGVDRYLSIEPLMKNDDIVLSNFRGVHGPAIADHAMAMLLSLTRNIKHYTARQEEEQWRRGQTPNKSIALEGKTMLVVGLGGIGSEIAQRANGFGMRVIGTRRSDSPSPDYIKQVGKPKDLLAMLPQADVVALAVPLTPETENLLNSEAFAAMKDGTYLINIARGKIVNTNAMLEALKSGKLAGACLDVTDPEPLTKGHPLWKETNVIITPHIAGQSEVTNERRSALTVENLRRFAAGEPLLNVVDKVAGY